MPIIKFFTRDYALAVSFFSARIEVYIQKTMSSVTSLASDQKENDIFASYEFH